jgi:TPR repeat protein
MIEQPNDPYGYSFLANAFIAQKKYKDALNLIDASISKGNKDSYIYLNRGLVNSYLGNFEQSIGDFENCLTIDKANKKCADNFSLSKVNLAKKFFEINNYTKSIEILRPMSENGDANASNNLAYILSKKYDMYNFDRAKEVFELYEKAANAGIKDAQYNLGLYYLNGTGIIPSPEKALNYFKMSADKNYPYGQYMYALSKLRGKGTTVNINEAKDYFQKVLVNPDSTETLKENSAKILRQIN